MQKVPEAPVEIDLPRLSTQEKVKSSHKDFYNEKDVVDEDDDKR